MSIFEVRTFHLLYVSNSSHGVGREAVEEMADISSKRNIFSSISGALLFDGSRFSQLLEGTPSTVLPLFKRIKADSCHQDVRVNASGHLGLPRLTTRWRFDHCEQHVMDPLADQVLPVDAVALALFMSALAAASSPER